MIRTAIATLVAGLFSYGLATLTVVERENCQGNWQYFVSPDNVKGRVIFHQNTNELCGVVPTASVTLVRTIEDDTIKVLELCNLSKKFASGELVMISPEVISESANVSVPVDTRVCSLRRTCFGVIKSVAE
ncbi:hypothetical protein [Hymenobacter perfusus]|uniref:Uncharacterized protein n=1 Tax=Hymenobacter perfusus TaxID=1236770 RepID=A0A3R9PNF1_9BACT|nr:hypothetical protein [Hymenobacter perfusus]RSK42279.1 hypothetical protein EI293_15260 [Hymenobacter perfusus]